MRNLALIGLAGAGLLLSVGLSSCGENHELTDRPISMDIYVDVTFSNDEVAAECMEDIMNAAKLAAGSRGSLKVHPFDGDPFRGRGLSKSFADEELPANVKGTSGETAYLEEQAEELEANIEALTNERPEVPKTPLIELLERAARHTAPVNSLNRILICTDGLFTDVNPKKLDEKEARHQGEALPPTLHGITVDFIGLDGSEPERGRWIERTKPLVRELLTGAGASMGNWDLELPPDWREEMIALAKGSGA